MNPKAYEFGAYYFPGFHSDPSVSRWHGRGWTEWELLKAAKPRFPGHAQPKIPLWGYEDEASPLVMQRKAKVASEYGINHFIFDWYFYEGKSFLNGALDRGFLKIEGGAAVKYALMWANHDWQNMQPASLTGQNPIMFQGAVDAARFDALTDHVVECYFRSPHYWTIDGCPYFSIYDLTTFLKGLGGVAPAADALKSFRAKVRRAGFKGVHLNLVHWQHAIVGSDQQIDAPGKVIAQLGFDSLSSYVWIHHFRDYSFPSTDYQKVLDFNASYWAQTAASFPIPYFPNVTMGWDSSPRTVQTDAFEERAYPYMSTLARNTPENFRLGLLAAKRHVDSQRGLPTKHLSINAWNEWTEGSYLEPDTQNGFAYLEAIRDVFHS